MVYQSAVDQFVGSGSAASVSTASVSSVMNTEPPSTENWSFSSHQLSDLSFLSSPLSSWPWIRARGLNLTELVMDMSQGAENAWRESQFDYSEEDSQGMVILNRYEDLGEAGWNFKHFWCVFGMIFQVFLRRLGCCIVREFYSDFGQLVPVRWVAPARWWRWVDEGLGIQHLQATDTRRKLYVKVFTCYTFFSFSAV